MPQSENTLPFPPEDALLTRLSALMEAYLPDILGPGCGRLPVLRGDDPGEVSRGGACVIWLPTKSTPEYPGHKISWLIPVSIQLSLDRGLTDPAARRAASQRLALLLFADVPQTSMEPSRAVERLSVPGSIRVRHISDEDVTDYPKTESWSAILRVSFTAHASALAPE